MARPARRTRCADALPLSASATLPDQQRSSLLSRPGALAPGTSFSLEKSPSCPLSSGARTLAHASFRFVLRAIRIALILALVFLPLPVAALVALVFAGNRREIPAEVLKKE